MVRDNVIGQIRNSAKALIVRDGALLTVQMHDEGGPFFILPGGGQEPGETLVDALRRECAEEIGVVVAVHELRFVREFIGRQHVRTASLPPFHRIEFMFRCSLARDAEPSGGPHPAAGQDAVNWLLLSELPQMRLYPLALRPLLSDGANENAPVYLGDVE